MTSDHARSSSESGADPSDPPSPSSNPRALSERSEKNRGSHASDPAHARTSDDTTRTFDVVVVGSVNQDVVARVERIPAPGETVLASSVMRNGGGKGANQAVAARRAGGAEVAFVGAVGTDDDGRHLRDALVADGIAVDGLATLDAPTGTALISVDAAGENAIVVVPGANAAIYGLTDAQHDIVTGATVLLTQLEIPTSLVLAAAHARRTNAWHVLNAAPSEPLRAERAALLAVTDVLIVNEHEALDITGADDLDAAVAELAPRVRSLVVTLGARGSLVVHGSTWASVSAIRADAVDTTGAGDTFCGVFAASIAASGRTPDRVSVGLLYEAARAGAVAAAIAVTRPGAQDAVPTADEVRAFSHTLAAGPTAADQEVPS